MVIYLGKPLPACSSDNEGGASSPICPLLSCTRWGLQDGQVAMPPVRSYRTFPPLPDYRRFLSVALALESPPPAVSWHLALRCSDFPHAFQARDHLAASRNCSNLRSSGRRFHIQRSYRPGYQGEPKTEKPCCSHRIGHPSSWRWAAYNAA
jgi:hypothetical protein